MNAVQPLRCAPGSANHRRFPPACPARYSTNADAFLMAVQDIAGASSGLGVVDQAKQVRLFSCLITNVLWVGGVKHAV